MSNTLNSSKFDYLYLVDNLNLIHDYFRTSSYKTINRNLTLRNWIFGWYIFEYEQKGEDRAKYGSKLILKLTKSLTTLKVSSTTLKLCRQFYLVYPQISQALPDQLQNVISKSIKGQAALDQSGKVNIKPEKLLENLSFTHFSELIKINDEPKRTFYEIETIKSCWSTRELKRQINTLFFERTGLSKNKEQMINDQNKSFLTSQEVLKDPFIFEFLEITNYDKVLESDLEHELMNHLQNFILELGNGFCFEARQKRIIIGDEYFYIDLVFYHRILKCHVLIELKVDIFRHEFLGQLNSYVAYYKKKVMEKTDNPPIGILLCTNKNQALVEFAKDSIDNQLFVSEYLLKLPKVDELKKFIENELIDFNEGT